MNHRDSSKRNIGVNFNQKGAAVVTLWAPEAKSVELKFSKGTISLDKGEFGYWSAVRDDLFAGDTYHFLIDDDIVISDPASLLLSL